MGKIEKIEQQIEQLSEAEFAELRDWILERDWALWDAQIANDAQSGKLDEFVKEAESEYREGRTREL